MSSSQNRRALLGHMHFPGRAQKYCEILAERLYRPRISHFGGSKTTARAGTRANEKDFENGQ
jgi:hypothetical protein